MKIFFFVLLLSFLDTNLFAEEKTALDSEKSKDTPSITETPNFVSKIPEKAQAKNISEKTISVLPSFGFGRGSMEIQNDKFQPFTSPAEFVLLSLYSASLVSQNAANTSAGGLSANGLAGIFYLSEELKKNLYSAKSVSVYNRFYVEKRVKKEDSGFQFGLSSGYFAINTDSSRYMQIFLPAILFSNSSPVISQYTAFSYAQTSLPIYTNITTFDFNHIKHILPDEKIDFYISLGGGIGGCLVECRAIKLAGKAGVRNNFNPDFFGFLEIEQQVLFLYSSDRKYSPILERVIFFGMGYTL
jgi:hypothetical protein